MKLLADDILHSIHAPSTDKVYLWLVTIEHESLSAPLRFVRDRVPCTSRGNLYDPAGFDIRLSADKDGEMPSVELWFDNVDQVLTPTIRTLETPPDMTIEEVLASDPDTVIMAAQSFRLRGCQLQSESARAQLRHEELAIEPYPVPRFVPTIFPGIFNPTTS